MSIDAQQSTAEAEHDRVRRFDVYDPSLPAHYHDTLRHARQHCPVAHSDELGGFWLITRYDDVKSVLSDPRTFTSSRGILIGAPPEAGTNSLIETDPPIQRDFRRLLDRLLSRRTLQTFEPAIRQVAVGLVDSFASRGECEVMHEYAGPMTAAVLATAIFGLDWETNRDEIAEASEAVEATSQYSGAESGEARAVLDRIVRRIIADRRAGEPRDDVIQALLDGTVEGRPLTESEIVGNLTLFVGAGLDTTKAAIGSIVMWMAQDPSIEARLRDPEWSRRGDLDEFLRLASPVTGVGREVTVDTEVGGQPLKAGDRIWALCASANRDESLFADPDAIDFERPRNPHVAFGLGVHRCIGSNLARMQLAIAIDTLLANVRNIRLQDGAEISFAPGIVRHPITVPIAFDRI